MEVVEIFQNWPEDFFRIEMHIGNICNYQCWYCWPTCHEGDIKWPDYDLTVKNLTHILDYYSKNTNKKRFQIGIMGGEVTYWKQFVPFIKHFKENYNCSFTIHTNASKKLKWWETAEKYLDHVSISHHAEFSKKEHNRDIADFLYSKKKIIDISVMMDPYRWNDCVTSIEYYLHSKYQWSIRASELFHKDIHYTDAQKEILEKFRYRPNDSLHFLSFNKKPIMKTEVLTIDGEISVVNDNFLTLNKLNNFYGWNCNLGVDWICIRNDGSIAGICGNLLYDQSVNYNFYEKDFVEKFHPKITSTICMMKNGCWCDFETNMPKKILDTNIKNKIIPIINEN